MKQCIRKSSAMKLVVKCPSYTVVKCPVGNIEASLELLIEVPVELVISPQKQLHPKRGSHDSLQRGSQTIQIAN